VLLSFAAAELAEVDSVAEAEGAARAELLRRIALAYARGELVTAAAGEGERYEALAARIAALEIRRGE